MEEREDLEFTTETEDTSPEDTEVVEEEAVSKDKIKQLRDKLKTCEQEKMKALEDLARGRADFLNAKKRLEEEKTKVKEQALVSYVEKLLPLVDSFALALADDSFSKSSVELQKGIQGIHSQLTSILKTYEVESFGAVGDTFDPSLHEALSDNGGGNEISEVLQKGFKLNDKVIRYAKVVIG